MALSGIYGSVSEDVLQKRNGLITVRGGWDTPTTSIAKKEAQTQPLCTHWLRLCSGVGMMDRKTIKREINGLHVEQGVK